MNCIERVKMGQKALVFVFTFFSFYPEMVWRLHRKGNERRKKPGFTFSFLFFVEVTALQFSADSIFYPVTAVWEVGWKLFLGKKSSFPEQKQLEQWCALLSPQESHQHLWHLVQLREAMKCSATRGRQGFPQDLGTWGVQSQLKGWVFPLHRNDIFQHWEGENCTILSHKEPVTCFPQVCQGCRDPISIKFLHIYGEKSHPATGMRCREKRKALVLLPSGTLIFLCAFIQYEKLNRKGWKACFSSI